VKGHTVNLHQFQMFGQFIIGSPRQKNST